MLKSNVDVVIELMGGLNPVEGWLKKAITSGKHVVTANKQLIAYKGVSLQKLAAQNGVQLVYNAAVAGGVPVDERHRVFERFRDFRVTQQLLMRRHVGRVALE